MATEWQAEFLRLTLFARDNIKIGDEVWSAITGEEESETRQRLPNGGRILAGRWAENQLSISFAGKRLDVILSPRASVEPAEALQFLVLGPWPNQGHPFYEATKKWLDTIDFPVVRVALGAAVLCEANDQKQAYEYLKQYLRSIDLQPDVMRDFQYRINWPKQSSVIPNMLVNRLTTWTVFNLTVANISLDSPAGVVQRDEKTAARMEVDNSTDASRTEGFESALLAPLYAELYELACRSATQGEEPC
jgi:hypothetical protein